MTAAAPAIELTEVQHAALAKIAASIARPGGVAVLCGPLGTGTSTVLAAVAAAMRLHARTVECRDLSDWEATLNSGGGELPDVVIADEAHRTQLAEALYRYCGLDTAAMVMIWRYWSTSQK